MVLILFSEFFQKRTKTASTTLGLGLVAQMPSHNFWSFSPGRSTTPKSILGDMSSIYATTPWSALPHALSPFCITGGATEKATT